MNKFRENNLKKDFSQEKYWQSISRDERGYPIFSASTQTYWTFALAYRGIISIDQVDYDVHFGPKAWGCIGRTKHSLPDRVHLVLIDLHNQFKKALSDEKELRKSLKNEQRLATTQEWHKNPDNKAGGKNYKAMIVQHEMDINLIYKLIVEGKTRVDIIEELKTKRNLTDRRINQLLTEANKKIKKTVDDERVLLKEKHHAMLWELYNLNRERGDFKECRTILETLNKMYGVNEDKKEIEIKQTVRYTFDTPQLNANNVQDIPFEFVKDHSLLQEPSDDELLDELDNENLEEEGGDFDE